MCLATVGAVPNRCWALPLCWGMSMLSGIMHCQPADIDIVGVAQSGHIRIAGPIPYFIGPALRSRIGPGLFHRMAVRIPKHGHIVVKDSDGIDQDELIRKESSKSLNTNG